MPAGDNRSSAGHILTGKWPRLVFVSRYLSELFKQTKMFRQSLGALGRRLYSFTPEERLIFDKLSKELSPSSITVNDVSGGCGSMFSIDVTSDRFKGLSMVKQHKLVNEILKDDIKRWHGLQLRTRSWIAAARSVSYGFISHLVPEILGWQCLFSKVHVNKGESYKWDWLICTVNTSIYV